MHKRFPGYKLQYNRKLFSLNCGCFQKEGSRSFEKETTIYASVYFLSVMCNMIIEDSVVNGIPDFLFSNESDSYIGTVSEAREKEILH